MNKPATKDQAIKNFLQQAHASQKIIEPDDQWRQQVMQSVLNHRLALDNVKSRIWPERLIWRSALALCSAACLLIVYAAATGLTMEPLAMDLFFTDPVETFRNLALLSLVAL